MIKLYKALNGKKIDLLGAIGTGETLQEAIIDAKKHHEIDFNDLSLVETERYIKSKACTSIIIEYQEVKK